MSAVRLSRRNLLLVVATTVTVLGFVSAGLLVLQSRAAGPDLEGPAGWPSTAPASPSLNKEGVSFVDGAVNRPSDDLSFRWTIPKSEVESFLFVRCDAGEIRVQEGNTTTGGPCTGGFRGLQGDKFRGDESDVIVTVTEPQEADWGLAFYR